jgi:hypothetical protein
VPQFLAQQAAHFFLLALAPHFLAAQAPHFLLAQAAFGRQRVAQPPLAQPASADAVTTAVAKARDRLETSELMVMSFQGGWKNG